MFYDQKIRKEVNWMIVFTAASYTLLHYIFGEEKETAILITMFVLMVNIAYDLIYTRNIVKNLQNSEVSNIKEHIDQRLERVTKMLNDKIDSIK